MNKNQENIWKVLIDLALRCDHIEYNTAHKWKERGAIPPSQHIFIVNEAEKAGIKFVTHSFLFNMWKATTKWKTANRRKK